MGRLWPGDEEAKGVDDLLSFGLVASALPIGPGGFAIAVNFKDSARSGDELRFDAELSQDGSRRTGSRGLIASRGAVGDLDLLHAMIIPQPTR
jgi:hypothetical protein